MKVYKIGRYYYKEIIERSHSKFRDMGDKERKERLLALVDYDGEPIKFFIKVKTKKIKFYHKQPCDCDICYNQKEILKQ